MKHRISTRTFGRRPEMRKALFRGLATDLLDHERITTTVVRAKELRKYVEPLITLGKRGDLHARRQAARFVYKKDVVRKLFGDIAPRFAERNGGYTRIYRLGFRRGDSADMAIIELTEKAGKTPAGAEPKKGQKAKATGKKTPAKKAKEKEAKASKKEAKAKEASTAKKKTAKKAAKKKSSKKK